MLRRLRRQPPTCHRLRPVDRSGSGGNNSSPRCARGHGRCPGHRPWPLPFPGLRHKDPDQRWCRATTVETAAPFPGGPCSSQAETTAQLIRRGCLRRPKGAALWNPVMGCACC